MINIRTKGQTGERELADRLNAIVNKVLIKLGIPLPPKPIIQRNQNQSAVGGSDLTNPFQLAIEVKRQEGLSINTWWAQCLKSANETKTLPVLIFRQNNQKWRVMLYGRIYGPRGDEFHVARVEITIEAFDIWFELWVMECIADQTVLGI